METRPLQTHPLPNQIQIPPHPLSAAPSVRSVPPAPPLLSWPLSSQPSSQLYWLQPVCKCHPKSTPGGAETGTQISPGREAGKEGEDGAEEGRGREDEYEDVWEWGKASLGEIVLQASPHNFI